MKGRLRILATVGLAVATACAGHETAPVGQAHARTPAPSPPPPLLNTPAPDRGPEEIAGLAKAVLQITVGDGHVYLSDGHAISVVARAGGTPVDFAGAASGLARDMAADDDALYHLFDDSVVRVRRSDGARTTLATRQDGPVHVAIDRDHVYWINQGPLGPDERGVPHGQIVRVAKAGGAPQRLASEQQWPNDLTVDDGFVYWTTFIQGHERGTIMRVAKAGGSPTQLTMDNDFPNDVVVDDASLYYTVRRGVMRLPKSGGSPQLIATSEETPFSIAMDADFVYWSCGTVRSATDSGFARRVPKTGGEPQTLLRNVNYLFGLVIDAGDLLYTQVDPYPATTGALMSLPLPSYRPDDR